MLGVSIGLVSSCPKLGTDVIKWQHIQLFRPPCAEWNCRHTAVSPTRWSVPLHSIPTASVGPVEMALCHLYSTRWLCWTDCKQMHSRQRRASKVTSNVVQQHTRRNRNVTTAPVLVRLAYQQQPQRQPQHPCNDSCDVMAPLINCCTIIIGSSSSIIKLESKLVWRKFWKICVLIKIQTLECIWLHECTWTSHKSIALIARQVQALRHTIRQMPAYSDMETAVHSIGIQHSSNGSILYWCSHMKVLGTLSLRTLS